MISKDDDESKYDVIALNLTVNDDEKSDNDVMLSVCTDGCVQTDDAYDEIHELFYGIKSLGIWINR